MAVAMTPRIRGRATRWLGSLGSKGDEQQQAASVAALVGGKRENAVKAVAKAASHFRTLSFDELGENDLVRSRATQDAHGCPRRAPCTRCDWSATGLLMVC